MPPEPTLTPSERLILAGLRANNICELIETYMDTDGVLTTPGALALWQKFFLASAGHSIIDYAAMMEKAWTHIGKLHHREDPVFPGDGLEQVLERSVDRAERMRELCTTELDTPTELCLTMAALSHLVAKLLAPHDGPAQP